MQSVQYKYKTLSTMRLLPLTPAFKLTAEPYHHCLSLLDALYFILTHIHARGREGLVMHSSVLIPVMQCNYLQHIAPRNIDKQEGNI